MLYAGARFVTTGHNFEVPDGLRVLIRRSKTDQTGEGQERLQATPGRWHRLSERRARTLKGRAMPDIAAQIETALAVMRLFDQIKALLPEGVAAIRHYPNATEEEKTKLHMLSYQVGELHARLMAEEEREEEAEEGS